MKSLREIVGFFYGAIMATQEQKARFMEIYNAAVKAGEPHPEVVAAQWAIESGWGAKQSGKNNFFGIKATQGEKGSMVNTHEVINGQRVSMPDRFKDYESLEEGIADRVNFTQRNPRYRKAGYFEATSPAEAALSLQKAGYATDPNYAKNLISVIKSAGLDPYNGQKYDYSTTKPQPIAQNTLQPQAIASFSSAFTPILPNTTETVGQTQTDFTNPFTNAFNQINGELEPLQDIPKQSNRQKYQQQLAQAFGVQPEVNNGLPDYIGALVRSIYDQTA